MIGYHEWRWRRPQRLTIRNLVWIWRLRSLLPFGILRRSREIEI